MPAISPSRRVAFQILCDVELSGLLSDRALNSRLTAALETRDRNLATEIVCGTLRWRLLLDYVLEKACRIPWNEVEPKIKILLRMAVYQMWHMDRIPDHALVGDAVELAKRGRESRATGFVNAVLRRLSRERPWNSPEMEKQCPPWIRVSLPRWLWERWSARYGCEAAHAYALSLNKPPQLSFWVQASGDVVKSLPEGIIRSDLVPGAYVCREGRALDLREGIEKIWFQDEASQMIPHLLGTISGWRVWDACAAPGGKSAILCEKCGESGWVVSSDISRARTKRLAKVLAGIEAARSDVLVADARMTPPFRVLFDAVVADVPCSGLGTLRRNPEIKWQFRPERLLTLQSSQKRILHSVAGSVRKGGLLLYATCSTEPEENEEVIEPFLRDHAEFCLCRALGPPGVEKWLDGSGYLRTFPNTHRWDGFFASVLERRR